MHRIRVYVDTSVFGGIQDEEFAAATEEFFRQVRQGTFVVLVSPLTTAELEKAPDRVRSVLRDLSEDQIEPILLDAEVKSLAEEYVRSEILGPASADDATHVAAATVAGGLGSQLEFSTYCELQSDSRLQCRQRSKWLPNHHHP